MIGYFARRLKRHRDRRTFREYGFEVKTFDLGRYGVVEYAQWLHPFERPKSFSAADVDGLRCFIREGDTAIDVGAHTGDTVLPMALACAETGLVIACEPNPYVFKVLEANAALNQGRTRIAPLNFAATETDGRYTFHYFDASFINGGNLSRLHNQRHGHRYPLQVEGRNLEQHLRAHFAERLPRLSFIKTDAEGYDKDVLHSIAGLLREFRPVVVCEVHKKLDADERRELYGVLASVNYTMHRYLGGASPVGEAVGEGDLHRWPAFDLVALPAERAAEFVTRVP
jgi:FkbM family methyltransferase